MPAPVDVPSLPLDEHGSIECFNRTLLEEWAYAHEYRSEAERAAAYPAWLHHYNHCESSSGWSKTGWQG